MTTLLYSLVFILHFIPDSVRIALLIAIVLVEMVTLWAIRGMRNWCLHLLLILVIIVLSVGMLGFVAFI